MITVHLQVEYIFGQLFGSREQAYYFNGLKD